MHMNCPVNKFNCSDLVEKYPFLKSIEVEVIEKNLSHVYMDTTLVLETTPLPDKFYELKMDVYSMIKEKTNKTPILRSGWNMKKFH